MAYGLAIFSSIDFSRFCRRDFLFYCIYGFTDVVLLVIAIIQTVLNIFSNEPSQTLMRAGLSLGLYVKQITEYLTYASEEKPFPFSEWPEPNDSISDQDAQ